MTKPLRNNGVIEHAGREYRVHGGWDRQPVVYVRVKANNNGWRKSTPHERRLGRGSAIAAKVIELFRDRTAQPPS